MIPKDHITPIETINNEIIMGEPVLKKKKMINPVTKEIKQ
jgi:hypothetical protein